MALSRNIVSVEVTQLNYTNFWASNNTPFALVVRICSTNKEHVCRASPLYREVVGLDSVFANRSFAVTRNQLDAAKLFANLPNFEASELYAYLTAYVGGSNDEEYRHMEKFKTWKAVSNESKSFE